jgi:hypothetical protein
VLLRPGTRAGYGGGLWKVRALAKEGISGCGGLRRQRETFAVHIAHISTSHLPESLLAGCWAGCGEYRQQARCVQKRRAGQRRRGEEREGGGDVDMRSALGSVSGSKASLTTVHAKLEAIVLRARRHQGVGNSIADARATTEYLRNAAAAVVLGEWVGAVGGEGPGREG